MRLRVDRVRGCGSGGRGPMICAVGRGEMPVTQLQAPAPAVGFVAGDDGARVGFSGPLSMQQRYRRVQSLVWHLPRSAERLRGLIRQEQSSVWRVPNDVLRVQSQSWRVPNGARAFQGRSTRSRAKFGSQGEHSPLRKSLRLEIGGLCHARSVVMTPRCGLESPRSGRFACHVQGGRDEVGGESKSFGAFAAKCL